MTSPLRNVALAHPFLVLAGAASILWLLRRGLRWNGPLPLPEHSRALLVPPLVLLALSVAYIVVPTYLDHLEPAIVSISTTTTGPRDVYPPPNDGRQVALPYGPAPFLLFGIPSRVWPSSIAATKIPSALCLLLSFILTVVAARRLGIQEERRVVAALATLLLAFGPTSFWVRADPIILLATSASLAAAVSRGRIAWMVLVFAIALGVGSKITASVYFLPALALLAKRDGVPSATLAFISGAAVSISPFVLSTQFDGASYWQWLRLTASHGVSSVSVVQAIEWMAVLFTSVAAVAGWQVSNLTRGIHSSALALGTAVAVCVVAPISAKVGAGPTHFLPLCPAIALLIGRWRGSHATAVHAVAGLLLALGLSQVVYVSRQIQSARFGAADELLTLLNTHPHPVAVGYTEDYKATFIRPVLTMNGQPYPFDPAALMDHQMSGIELGEAAVDAVRRCAVATWMLPTGGTPFALPNVYVPTQRVFPQDFREAFLESYRRTEQHSFFDVWRCRKEAH
jgi:hypothetical protein